MKQWLLLLDDADDNDNDGGGGLSIGGVNDDSRMVKEAYGAVPRLISIDIMTFH